MRKKVKKNLGGRPFKFGSIDHMREVIEHYFKNTLKEEYTMTGLALAIGSKQLMALYATRDGFKDLIETARLRVENSYELSLRKHGRSGDIFALKNMGWTDTPTTVVDQSTHKHYTSLQLSKESESDLISLLLGRPHGIER